VLNTQNNCIKPHAYLTVKRVVKIKNISVIEIINDFCWMMDVGEERNSPLNVLEERTTLVVRSLGTNPL
jgi:hypothetical protein